MNLDTMGLSRSERTRLLLCRAAERIVAEDGPNALSLRSVALRAGQRNVNAATYHFGDVDNLLWSSIQGRAQQMEQERALLLAEATERRRLDDLETLFRCLGMPILSIVDEDGHHIFAQFQLQMFVSHHPYTFLLREIITPEFPARSKLVELLLKRLDHIRPDRLRYIMPALIMMPLNAVSAYDMDRKEGKPTPPLKEVCDTAYGMLAASAARL